MKVGFVGLGIMGRPMCLNLLKAGYEVTAYDPFAAKALDEVVAAGAVRGTSNADVASKSDVIITMVPNSPHVRAAVFDKGGIAEGAKEGLDIIDMSSIAPLESKDIAEKWEGSDFDYVLYFRDGRIDPYYYCIHQEMGHTIYHRFLKEDWKQLMTTA